MHAAITKRRVDIGVMCFSLLQSRVKLAVQSRT